MDTLKLQILDITITIHFTGKIRLPLNEYLKRFEYLEYDNIYDPNSMQVSFVDDPIDRGFDRHAKKPSNSSITMSATSKGLFFNFYTGQFLADQTFTKVQLWSPYDREISLQRDGVPNFNGDPALRLILWARASIEGYCYMHGALNVLDGKYILFMGDSGVGKTTLSNLACDLGATCLTEEDPFLAWNGSNPIAYGTPWPGIKGPDVPKSGNLAAIFFLRHAPENQICRLDSAMASRRLLHNSRIFKWLPQVIPGAIELIDAVAKSVPAYDFGFVPDRSAIEEIRRVL